MKSISPKVTVYITNYNYGKYIIKAIESVLDQSLQNFEVLIIDDGSTDESIEILKSYDDNPKINIIKQNNKGLTISNNVALKIAKGKYIMRLDADDFLFKYSLETLSIELDKDPEIGMVFGDYYTIDEHENIIEHFQRHNFNKDVSLFDQPAHGACTMFRIECLRQLGGYDETIRRQDGYELWLRFIEKYKVTWTELSPALIRNQMTKDKKLFENLDLSSLRIICTGGEPWTEKPWKWLFEFIGKSKVPIMNSAGGTEVSGSILHCCLHRPFKVGSFNAPIPGMSADIVDTKGERVSADQMGELVMRKSSIGLTKSLWNDDERYIQNYWKVIKNDLWVHGDLASKDKDGHWYLHGRSDDTIKISGKRIGPSELESVIVKSGKVKEVAAVGIPDEGKGSKIILSIVPLESEKNLKENLFIDLIIKDLGKSFKPDKVIFVKDLPKTRNMKIMRRVIKSCLTNEDPGDISTLLNPESVEEIKQHAI